MHNVQHDIDKYLKGELTSTEMHALERKALNDPFLADALEGAQYAGSANFSEDMSNLQRSLKNRTKEKTKVIPLWSWTLRIAAGLLVVAVSTFIINTLFNTKQSEDLALNKSTPTFPDQQPPTIHDSVVSDRIDLNRTESIEESREPVPSVQNEAIQESSLPPKTSPVAPSFREGAASDANQVEDVKGELTEDHAVEAESKEEKTNDRIVAKRKAADDNNENCVKAPQPVAEEAKKLSSPTASQTSGYIQVVRGKVTSADDDTGLPGVNVTISGTNTGTVTDKYGEYTLSLANLNQSLVFSFIGMESKEVDAGASDIVDVALEADVSQLSEVVVVGYGAEKTEADEMSTIEFAVPEGGRLAFKKYLEKGLRYPQQAIENSIEGKVTIQFTVEASGQLTDFKVLKGIGHGCDEEVVRLIKKGPKWAPTKREADPRRDHVKVRMRFKLPKK